MEDVRLFPSSSSLTSPWPHAQFKASKLVTLHAKPQHAVISIIVESIGGGGVMILFTAS
jgi:hypothetical protein